MTAFQNRLANAVELASTEPWNCLSHVLGERAIETARLLDAMEPAAVSRLPLAGVPYVVKSLFDVKGIPTLAGGPADPNGHPADSDASLVQILGEAGAVPIAVAHMDEYAYGFLGDNPHYGPVINPADPRAFAGGSSSGCAAAVAAGIVPFAIGSDTNGSVRVPAAFCGLYALKPSHGKLPLQGSFPLAPSLDHAGIIASSLDWLRRVWSALAPGRDSRDGAIAGFITGDHERLSKASVRDGYANLRARWREAPDIALNHVEASLSAASIITGFEAAAVHRDRLAARPHLYSRATAARLAAAAQLSAGDYGLALRVQRSIRDEILDAMDSHNVDVLVVPTTPVDRIAVGEKSVVLDGICVLAPDAVGLFTRPFSLAGLPVLTVPRRSGTGHSPGRPALQLIGRANEETTLFGFAAELLKSDGNG